MQTKFAILKFSNSSELSRGSDKLIKHGFGVERLVVRADDDDDWEDDDIDCTVDGTPFFFVNTWTLSDLDNAPFYDSVQRIIGPVGGDVVAAGPGMMQHCPACGRLRAVNPLLLGS